MVMLLAEMPGTIGEAQSSPTQSSELGTRSTSDRPERDVCAKCLKSGEGDTSMEWPGPLVPAYSAAQIQLPPKGDARAVGPCDRTTIAHLSSLVIHSRVSRSNASSGIVSTGA